MSTRRTRWWAAGGAALFGLVVVALVLSRGAVSPAGVQPIELPRLNGEGTVSLASYRGQPVVVNFFASWCIPCRKELPAFQAVADRFEGRVAFLGVNHQDNREGALALLADAGVRYPAGYDPDGLVATAYGLFGMPTTLFVSADGQLVAKHTGELTQAKLEEMIADRFGL